MAAESVSRIRRIWTALRDAATRNVPLKVLSLVIASGLWAFVNFGERDSEEALKVPLQFRNIPARLMITSPRVDFIDVRVVGPRTLLGRIDHNQLAIPLDFSGARSGPAIFSVNVDRLNLPRGVRVVRVTPSQVTVMLERVRRKTVPVQLRIEGEPPPEFRVVTSTTVPDRIEITGPESLVAPIESVSTEPIPLDTTSRAPIRQELRIEPLGEYVTPRPGSVRADVVIEEIRMDRTFARVPVQVLADEGMEATAEPANVQITLLGPRRVVDAVAVDGLAGADVTGLEPGEHDVAVRVALPDEAELVSVVPGVVRVTIAIPTPTPVPMSFENAGATPLERPGATAAEGVK